MNITHIGWARDLYLRYGIYCGIRAAKNRGIGFEEAYFAVFGRLPRF